MYATARRMSWLVLLLLLLAGCDYERPAVPDTTSGDDSWVIGDTEESDDVAPTDIETGTVADSGPPEPDTEPPDPDDAGQPDAQPDAGTKSYPNFETAVREFLGQSKASGAAVAIVDGGRVTLAKGYGSKYRNQQGPVDAETLFGAYAMTQPVTTLGVLSAHEDTQLDVTKPVKDYVDYFDAKPENAADKITAAQLLSHTSGYPNWINHPSYSGMLTSSRSLAGVFREKTDVDMLSSPGSLYNVSSSGYALAALTMQEAVERPYRDAIGTRVFDAAGLPTATFRPSDQNNRAFGYYDQQGQVMSFDPGIRPDHPFSDAYHGLHMGSEDLGSLLKLLVNEGRPVLNSETYDAMLQTRVPDRRDTIHGRTTMGFQRRTTNNGTNIYLKSGVGAGFSGILAFVPSRDFGVAVMTNWGPNNPAVNQILAQAFNRVVGMSVPNPVESFPRSEWSKLTGDYEDKVTLGHIEVEQDENGELTIEFKDAGETRPLEHVYGRTFTVGNVPSKIANRPDYPNPVTRLSGTFLMDDKGEEATHFRTIWGVAPTK